MAKSIYPLLTCLLLPVSALGQSPATRTELTYLAFTPDGTALIAASLNGYLAWLHPATGKERLSVLAHKGGVYSAQLSRDGKWLASGGADKVARLWNVAKIKEVAAFEAHDQEVLAVAVSPDGQLAASGTSDGVTRIWEVSGERLRHTLRGQEKKVTALAFSANSRLLASGGIVPAERAGFVGSTQGDQLRLWDVSAGRELAQLPQRGQHLAVSPDGTAILAAGMYLDFVPGNGGFSLDGGSRVVLVHQESRRELFKVEHHGAAAALSADGRYLATGWGTRLHGGGLVVTSNVKNKGLHIWEVASGREVLAETLPEDGATVLAFTPDGTRLAAARQDGVVQFHDLRPKPLVGTESEIAKCWDALAGTDSPAAYTAMWALVDADAAAIPFLKARLKPVSPAGADVRKLIADLDSEQFAVRAGAERELGRLGSQVETNLKQALESKPSAEASRRLRQLLDALEATPPPPEVLRERRALATLERMKTTAAQGLLRELAAGAPGARLTRDSAAALSRLQLRSIRP